MRKILIISSNRLGDCILASGLNNFFNNMESSQITFVCGPVPAELFQFCKNIKNLISLPKQKYSLHWIQLWRKIIFNKWDIVLDLRGSLISYILFSKKKFIYKDKYKIKHKVETISKLVSNKILAPSIKINHSIMNKNRYLNQIIKISNNRKIIMISPSANWIGKIWPIERFELLIRKLKKLKEFKKAIFIIVGSKDDENNILKLFDDKSLNLFNLVGKTNLAEIFLIMKKIDLFIGNDSGLMHLAALANSPTIGLFGPSDSSKYGPWGKKTMIIKNKSPNELMGHEGFNPKNVESLMIHLGVGFVYKNIVEFYNKL